MQEKFDSEKENYFNNMIKSIKQLEKASTGKKKKKKKGGKKK